MMFGQLSKEAALNQWLHILHPSREQLAQPVQQALLEPTELTAQLVQLAQPAQLARKVFKV